MVENPNYDPDYCYECSGYGDNYYMDEGEDGELVCRCPECPFSEFWEDK